ncbi:MAG: DNA polymerase III subunit epsilon [Halothiobacillus sp. 24-54-40]|jgi:DNA polymerase-3 subunit epsilon|nr:MAG: DNA polymerase III subunit epsilon [Halothiobacillus sp. 20-53-49]OYY33582.1 MAG: DNA polymerase III subunit epsilon [Halothiobacillus sp. 35-54-62]OYZ86510.1 MAG: DNA polymerase III subunit epsilon [Halothiobacillus sp. 24-54-40]OZA79953.1 MAG: DNA polymerase III subunit epsilon [Halothiobacillus sp. 39-53-45]HQS01561.1 3'-5' exonuclease [Halothiobacillus sp.]
MPLNTFAVIDFETTGLSPEHGARPTEIAIVLVRNHQIVDRYQSLMNPEMRIPADIQALTGITQAMVRTAPSIEAVMKQAADFAGQYPLVAHNAAFDRKFWDAETQKINHRRAQPFVCSLLLSRRLFPDVPNHRLGTLVQTLNLPQTGRFHRALADAQATAHLLMRIQSELKQRYELEMIGEDILCQIQTIGRKKMDAFFKGMQIKK